jgi:SAM-dependent methyltransferase
MNGMGGMGSSAAVTATTPGRQRADVNVATMTAIWPTGLNDRHDPSHGAGGTALRERAADPFTQAAFDCAAEHPAQAVAILQVGATTAGDELDATALRMAGCDAAVTLIDDDTAAARAAAAGRPELRGCTLCDLRMAPLAPRSADIVHCALLLERISHAELVLDRLVETLRPGGVLLLQAVDRDCAIGFLDRVAPRPVRALIWRSLRPGGPGPYPAVYERLVSERGIQSYVLRRGLVIAQRQTLSLLPGRRRPLWLKAASGLVASLSRGRLTSAHDELRYVIRKPEDLFARVL